MSALRITRRSRERRALRRAAVLPAEGGWQPGVEGQTDEALRDLAHDYRVPSGPAIGDLIPPGSIVSTNYGSGPYVVVELGPQIYEPPEGGRYEHWSLSLAVLPRPGYRAPTGATRWISGVVAVDGRLLQLLRAGTDEVLIGRAGPRE